MLTTKRLFRVYANLCNRRQYFSVVSIGEPDVGTYLEMPAMPVASFVLLLSFTNSRYTGIGDKNHFTVRPSCNIG